MSVPMSTYLVAFVVSDFEFREAEDAGNQVQFKIWARRNAIDQTEYATIIGPKIMAYFEEFFSVPYPLPKQVRII